MSPTASPRLDRRRLRALLEPVVARTGAELEDVTERRAGARRLVTVVVDRDGGVSMDDVAEITRVVSDALDASDALGDAPYLLEVSSPGVDRPLTEPRHWRRARGRLVKAVLRAGGEAVGRVADSDDERVTLLTGPQELHERVLAYGEIAKARMQIEFNRADEDADGAGGDEDLADAEVEGSGAPTRAD